MKHLRHQSCEKEVYEANLVTHSGLLGGYVGFEWESSTILGVQQGPWDQVKGCKDAPRRHIVCPRQAPGRHQGGAKEAPGMVIVSSLVCKIQFFKNSSFPNRF